MPLAGIVLRDRSEANQGGSASDADYVTTSRATKCIGHLSATATAASGCGCAANCWACPSHSPQPDFLERYRQLTGRSLLECPACGAEAMHTVAKWRTGEEPPPLEDTS